MDNLKLIQKNEKAIHQNLQANKEELSEVIQKQQISLASLSEQVAASNH